MEQTIERFDARVINFFRKYSDEFARFSFFIVFFWFGILKTFQISPAGPLVLDLLNNTFLRFISESTFMISFGLFEMLIGLLILTPRMERITFFLMLLHLITTAMPLWVLPEITWDSYLAPSLIGQYIIKNMVLLASGMMLFARIKPMSETHTVFGEEEKSIEINS